MVACHQEAPEGPAKVAFPADAGGAYAFGRENSSQVTPVKEEDRERHENGSRGGAVKPRGQEKGEVAEDDRAGSDMVGVTLADQPHEAATESRGSCRDRNEGPPPGSQEDRAEEEKRERVACEVTPGGVEDRSKKDSLQMREAAWVNAVGLQGVPEQEAVGHFDQPKQEDYRAPVA